jgi:hypothetical protein
MAVLGYGMEYNRGHDMSIHDGEWHRFRIRYPEPQIMEVRHRVNDAGASVEDVVLYTPTLQLVELGVERNYPYHR